jgi:hypothetical protein
MNPGEFWNTIAKLEHQQIEMFVDKPRAMDKALRQMTSPADAPEAKLKKIYDRAQRLNNLSLAPKKTEEEARRNTVVPPRDAEDVWRSGQGTAREISWLFLALARAAGFKADPVLAAGRNHFFDPGNPYAPFGQLPWYETAVAALRLNREGGTWIETPPPLPAGARIERTATLDVDPFGALSGRLAVSFIGAEATWRRIAEREADAPARRRFLEDELKASITAPSDVTLTNEPAWESADDTLEADFTLRIDAWADVAGRRMLLPAEVFGGAERRLFEHASRVQPVYFDFPFMRRDDVSVSLPPGLRADIIPQVRQTATDTVSYTLAIEPAAGGLRFRRDLTINLTQVKVAAYDSLRHFYQAVRAGDEQQVVLSGARSGGTE